MSSSIYVGCAITHAPTGYAEKIAQLKDALRARSCRILEFASIEDPGHERLNIYRYDMLQVEEAELFVALVDYPSTGLGMEFEHACANNIPMLVFAHQEALVAKIVPDMLAFYGRAEIIRIEDLDQVIGHVEDYLSSEEFFLYSETEMDRSIYREYKSMKENDPEGFMYAIEGLRADSEDEEALPAMMVCAYGHILEVLKRLRVFDE